MKQLIKSLKFLSLALILFLGNMQIGQTIVNEKECKDEIENLFKNSEGKINRPYYSRLKLKSVTFEPNKFSCNYNEKSTQKINLANALNCFSSDGSQKYIEEINMHSVKTERNKDLSAQAAFKVCDDKLSNFNINNQEYSALSSSQSSVAQRANTRTSTSQAGGAPIVDASLNRDPAGINSTEDFSIDAVNERVRNNSSYGFPKKGTYSFVKSGSCNASEKGNDEINKLYNAPTGQTVCFNNSGLKNQADAAKLKFDNAAKSYGKFDPSMSATSQSFDYNGCKSQFGEAKCNEQKEEFNAAKSVALSNSNNQNGEVNSGESIADSSSGGVDQSDIDGGDAYSLTDGRQADDYGTYNIGTEDDPVYVPGNLINNVTGEVKNCINERKNNEGVNKGTLTAECEKVVADQCKNGQNSNSWCSGWRKSMTGQDLQISSEAVNLAVRTGSSSAEIRSRLDFGGQNCLEYFTGSKEGKDLANPEFNFIDGSKFRLIGADTNSVYSNRIIGGLYSSTNACQQVFGGGNAVFTEFKASEKLRPRNTQKYCMDVLQANLDKAGNAGPCQQALELLSNPRNLNECIVPDPRDLSAEKQAEIDLCKAQVDQDVARARQVGGGSVSAGDLVSAYATCSANVTGPEAQDMIKPECNNAYDLVKACLDGNGGDQIASMVDISTGCVALNNAAIRIKDEGDFENGEQYQTIDSQMSGFICNAKAAGSVVYALDYLACKRAALWYNAAFLTNDMLAPIATNAVGALKSADIEGDKYKDLAKGGVDAQTAALRAQKKQYQNKANMETTKGVLQGAKAMAMFGNMMFYPTPNIVSKDWCEGENIKDFKFDAASACSILRMSRAQPDSGLLEELFVNQHAKKIMLDTGFQALSQAIVSAIVAGTYKKRAKLVGQVEKTLAEADFLMPENQIEIGPDFCVQNPNVPTCRGFRGGRVSNNGGVDFSFGGGIQNGGGNLDISDGAELGEFNGGDNVVAPSNADKQQIENLLGGSSDKKDTPDFKKIGAAKGSAASGGGAGGGGGGGAGASGGGGGGGGEAPAKKQAGPTTPSGKRQFGKYVAGQNGKFSSGGSVRGKKNSSNNPFAALRGKGNRKIASEVEKELLPKKVQIFEAISRRYAEVSKSRERISIDKEYLIKTK